MFYKTNFLFFGGHIGISRTSNIYQLNSKQFNWKLVGKLNHARHGHSVVILDDHFLVVGGNGYFETERCKYSSEKIDCVKQEPKINMWKFYPALMVVDDNYCK